ncbi:GNAT family N-acetyltransferase [Kineothrix sp. MB12-C1]|uniref:GNAT family N-acetyltransferase n=1 Tax=Kineothrix sp. MB12-C1 TaxID=3070215 RepID=UPI0027D24B1D|nr:GNAT family N-acetyltransferase [Kineothrix sp. MB12-C1]WMC91430.1 GNAT family N-acetyltransferase [Kineothrix sp. MB12-C1]
MVSLKEINEDNFRAVVGMKLEGEQSKYVASNVYSLAQAWLYPEEAKPYAIYKDEEIIGFMMLDWDEEERECGIWRFMIANDQQGKGYGRKALEYAVNRIKETGKFDYVSLDYAPGNNVGKHLYESVGFRETGEIEEGEIIMKLDLIK